MGWPILLAVTAFRWMNFLYCLFLYCMNLRCTFLCRKVHLFFFSARSQFQSNPCFLGGNNLKYRVLIGDVLSRYVRYGLSYTATKRWYGLFSHTGLNTCTASLLSLSVRFELRLIQPGSKVCTCKLLYNSSTFNLIVQLVGIAFKQTVFEETCLLW